MNREKEKGIFVDTITLFGKDIRVVNFEDRLWFVSADLFRAMGIANLSGNFYKKVPAEMKKSVAIVGDKYFKRIVLPEYLKLLANRSTGGKFFRNKLFINEFVNNFLKKSGEEEKELKQEEFKGITGKIVFTTSFCKEFIRVVKFEDRLWFMSADLRKAMGIIYDINFSEKVPEELKRSINIEGYKGLKRIILPEGLRLLAKRAVRGNIYRHRSVINEFVDDFFKKSGEEEKDLKEELRKEFKVKKRQVLTVSARELMEEIQEELKNISGTIVFSVKFCGESIRVVKFENRLWFVSGDLSNALGLTDSENFCEKVPEKMKRVINIEGTERFKRIILPEGVKLLAERAGGGKVFRYKSVIKEFFNDFLKKSGEGEEVLKKEIQEEFKAGSQASHPPHGFRLKEEIQEELKGITGKIVFGVKFCGEIIRVVRFEDKLWFVSADLSKAIGLMHSGHFRERITEGMERSIDIEGYKRLNRIILPEGLKLLAERVASGKIYRHKSVIKKFVDTFLENYQSKFQPVA